MIGSFAYDTDYEPAAPVMTITIGPAGQSEPRQPLTAIVDSGADATLVPDDLLVAIGARYVERRQMRGITGATVPVNMYLVAVHIGDHTLQGIRVVAVPGEEPVIGRDILNQLVVTMNGLGHTLEIRSE